MNLFHWKFTMALASLSLIAIPASIYIQNYWLLAFNILFGALLLDLSLKDRKRAKRPKTQEELINENLKVSYNLDFSKLDPPRKLMKAGETIMFIDERNGVHQEMMLLEDEEEGQPLQLEPVEKMEADYGENR